MIRATIIGLVLGGLTLLAGCYGYRGGRVQGVYYDGPGYYDGPSYYAGPAYCPPQAVVVDSPPVCVDYRTVVVGRYPDYRGHRDGFGRDVRWDRDDHRRALAPAAVTGRVGRANYRPGPAVVRPGLASPPPGHNRPAGDRDRHDGRP